MTAVRPADADDLLGLQILETRDLAGSHGDEGALFVIGQPLVGLIRVALVEGAATVVALRVDPGPAERTQFLEESLLTAARGWAMDRGHGSLKDDQHRHVTLTDEPPPRPAVSVLPLRDGVEGLEVFVQHRVSTMDFAAGAVVFPGGRVDPEDAAAGAALQLDPMLVQAHAQAWERTDHAALGGGGAAASTIIATALREVREETGAHLHPAELVPWDNWVTPPGYHRRFDVRFMVAPVDHAAGDGFGNTTTEAHRSTWTAVHHLVEQAERGNLHLMSPTRTLVDELAGLGDLAAVLALQPDVRAIHHDTAQRRPRPAGRRARAR